MKGMNVVLNNMLETIKKIVKCKDCKEKFEYFTHFPKRKYALRCEHCKCKYAARMARKKNCVDPMM